MADSAAETDPRALEKVRLFLQTLADNDAVCAMQYRDKVFRFHDISQVRTSLARISQDNLHEERTQLRGEFQGMLPKRRTFEFRLAEIGSVIRGKVGPSIADPEAINQHLHRQTIIDVLATRVGSGRPRYLLVALPTWDA